MTTIRDAPWPFSGGSEPLSDIILRASDAVDFHCHKFLLTLGSGFFHDMVEVASDDDTVLRKAGNAVVLLPEPAGVLHRLLLILYPDPLVDSFSLKDPSEFQEIFGALVAADKYEMEPATNLISSVLLKSPLLFTHPVQFFAWGVGLQHADLVASAAYHALNAPIPTQLPDIPLPGVVYYPKSFSDLSAFHKSRGERARYLTTRIIGSLHAEMLEMPELYPQDLEVAAACDAHTLLPFIWWDDEGHTAGCGATCGPIDQSGCDVYPATWYLNHVARVSELLLKAPGGCTAAREAFKLAPPQLAAVAACAMCSQFAQRDLNQYAIQLAALIDDGNLYFTRRFWKFEADRKAAN
ncbi:hypothetical protein C8R47DRAFT_1064214 [Mycena vitilis]|nr:hypothetical protein C8R47DRAFT_1064214 [Mycena vitilis]